MSPPQSRLWGDDTASAATAVLCADLLSWFTWRSKEARNAGMAAVMRDPRMKYDPDQMPFDGKHMTFGFRVLVNV